MTKQSRAMSLVESTTNIVVGFWISVTANYLVLPAFGYAVNFIDSIGIGLIMTIISLIRSYSLRRMFEAIRVNSEDK